MELYRPYHLLDYGGAISIVDMLAVSQARLLLGGGSARYGDRLSAVLDIKLKEPSETLQVNAGIDLLNAHLFVSKKPFLVAARVGYIGFLMGAMQSDETLVPHYGDLLVKFEERVSLQDRLSVHGIYAGDTNRIDRAGEEGDVKSVYHNGAVWARWQHEFGPEASLDTLVYAGQASQDREEGVADQDDRHLAYGGVKAGISVAYAAGCHLRSGFDVRWMQGRYDYTSAGDNTSVHTRLDGVTCKGFLSNAWRIVPGLDAVFGARILHSMPDGRTRLAPAAALSFTPLEGFTLKAAFSRCYQPVDPLNLPVEAGISDLIRPEEATHYVLGIEVRHKPSGLRATLEAYYKERDNLTGFILDRGLVEQVRLQKDSGWAEGVECSLDKRFGTLLLVHLGYTWSKTRDRFQGRSFWGEHDRRHAFFMGLHLQPGKDWSIYLGWRYHSGEPFTRVWYEGALRHTGETNEGRYPPYHSLDLRVGKVFRWEGVEVQLYVQILNLYNRQNVQEYSFLAEESGGNTVYVRQEENLFPFLPSLGIQVKF
jgi:outer membrane receptor protein involved in Fe transport